MTAIARARSNPVSVLLMMFLIARPYVLSTQTIVLQLRNKAGGHQTQANLGHQPHAIDLGELIAMFTETEIVQGQQLPLV